MANPCHSIGFCPVCGDGLCGVRIFARHGQEPYGLVVCDECDAVWTSPDLSGKPIFPDTEDARSPVDGQPLWGPGSHWADLHECARLGWFSEINPALSRHGIPPVDDDPLALSSPHESGFEPHGLGSPPASAEPTDDGPTDDGPTDDGPTDDGPTDEGLNNGETSS